VLLRPRLAIITSCLIGLLLQAGCHQRLIDVAPRRPNWSSVSTSSDEELSRFIAANPEITIEPTGFDDPHNMTRPRMRWLALLNDAEVSAARAHLLAARAIEGSADNWADPEIDGRYLTDEDGKNEYEAALIFAIPWGGRTSASGKAAKFQTELARINFDGACQRALWDLDGAFSQLAWAKERLAVQQDLATRSDHFASLGRSRQEANVADPLDVALIIADAASDQRAVLRSRQELQEIERNLALRLGIAPEKWFIETLPLVPVQVELDKATIEMAAQCRSDWLAAWAAYQQAEWDAAAAARQRIPDLAVGPVVTSADSESSYGVTAGIALPIFSGAGAHYKAALARRDGAFDGLNQAARVAAVEIENHKFYLLSIQEELTLLGQGPLTATEEAMALAGERYGAGQIDILLLLSAQRVYSDLKLELLDLRLEFWNALLALEKAVGCSLRETEMR
jgi:outer membrane protein TolC